MFEAKVDVVEAEVEVEVVDVGADLDAGVVAAVRTDESKFSAFC